jgi:hypothetical protein
VERFGEMEMTDDQKAIAGVKAKRNLKMYFFLEKIMGLGMAFDIACSDFRFKYELADLFLKIDEKLGKIFLDD